MEKTKPILKIDATATLKAMAPGDFWEIPDSTKAAYMRTITSHFGPGLFRVWKDTFANLTVVYRTYKPIQ